MMRLSYWLLPLFFALPALAAENPPAPKQGLGIAAIVDGEAISSYDVENRMRFILATTKLSNTPEVLERIHPQVVQSLIDEKIQMEEAARNKLSISDQDVTKAINAIEEQRGMSDGAILRMLRENNVPEETFTRQIRAQLGWNRVIGKKIRPLIKISEDEIKQASDKFSAPAPAVNQELKIAVIALPVDKPQRENEVHRLAEKFAREIQGGASFEEVSRQFSSGSAASGGKVESFWVRPGQLDGAVSKALTGAKAGTIAGPVRTAQGFSIIKVYDARALATAEPAEMAVILKAILLRLKPEADKKEADVLLQIGEEVAKHPGTCEEKGLAGMKDMQDFDIEVDFRRATMSELPPALKIIAENLKVGDISTPFASAEGIRLYMLCGREKADQSKPDPERIFAMLMQQRIELEAQKYMRNLRRDAFIEVR